MLIKNVIAAAATFTVAMQSVQLGFGQVQMQMSLPAPLTVLKEGTPIRMGITQTVSSSDAHKGDGVSFETIEDIKVGESVVIPKGSTAIAVVTLAVPKRRMARGGKLSMDIQYVRMPSGDKLPLRGVQDVKGGGSQGKMVAAMAAAGILFFPAAPLFLLVTGKDITIPKGHEVTVFTNADFNVTNPKTGSPAVPTVPTAGPTTATGVYGSPLTNADILKLRDAGLGEQLIIDKIKTSPPNYQLEATNLIDLKAAGLSDAVISAMLETSKVLSQNK